MSSSFHPLSCLIKIYPWRIQWRLSIIQYWVGHFSKQLWRGVSWQCDGHPSCFSGIILSRIPGELKWSSGSLIYVKYGYHNDYCIPCGVVPPVFSNNFIPVYQYTVKKVFYFLIARNFSKCPHQSWNVFIQEDPLIFRYEIWINIARWYVWLTILSFYHLHKAPFNTICYCSYSAHITKGICMYVQTDIIIDKSSGIMVMTENKAIYSSHVELYDISWYRNIYLKDTFGW